MKTIDADLLAEEITARSIANQAYIESHAGSEWAGLIRLIYNSALEEISNAPAVDAVPVVRCKHCKYAVNEPYNGEDVWICERTLWSRCEGRRHENDFCSYGKERRTVNHEQEKR